VFILWQFGVAGRSVSSKALDEESHCDDEPNTHQQHCVPVGRHPLSYCEESSLVEKKIFQPD
jgi:hypothetical protein